MGSSIARPALLAAALSVAACGDAGPVGPAAAPPPPEPASQVAGPATSPGRPDDTVDALLDDALTRVLPALGPRGEALTVHFAHLQAAKGPARGTALRTLRHSLAAFERQVPADLQPDFAALVLNVEAMDAATDHPTH